MFRFTNQLSQNARLQCFRRCPDAERKSESMRPRLIAAACIFFAVRSPVSGQVPAKVPEPEYLGTFFLLDSSTGTLKPLERQVPENRLKYAGVMGFGSAEGYVKVTGAQSPVRFREGQRLDFVTLAPSQQTDPQEIISLFSLESLKDSRRLVIDKARSVLGVTGSNSVMSESQIAFDAAKWGVSSFKLTPTQHLYPGEYILFGSSPKVAFCFGIDADPSYQSSHADLVVPLRTAELIPLGIVEGVVTIKSAEVTSWPSPGELQKAERLPVATTTLTVKFTYSNRGTKDWKYQFRVTALDDKGEEIASGDRDANLDEGDKSGKVRVSIKMRTLDFPRVTKLRIRALPRPQIGD